VTVSTTTTRCSSVELVETTHSSVEVVETLGVGGWLRSMALEEKDGVVPRPPLPTYGP